MMAHTFSKPHAAIYTTKYKTEMNSRQLCTVYLCTMTAVQKAGGVLLQILKAIFIRKKDCCR
jgi:hypothetical protein